MATGPAYNPLISPDACRVWLNELPKADPQALVVAITDALGELPGRGGMDALKVVETLRAPMLQYLETLASRYADKLLPLMPAQAAALAASDRLTRRLAEAYADGIPQSLAATDEYLSFAALLHQRAVFWSVQGMIAYLRARQRVPDDLWNVARHTLASAERAGLTRKAVRDSLQADGKSSVAATYGRGLLLHLCGARSMSGREFEYTCQIAGFFERKLELRVHPAGAGGSEQSAEADGAKLKTVRMGDLEHVLDVTALAQSIGGRLAMLNRGSMIESPTLAPPSPVPVLRSLFGKLYGAWCTRTNQRRFPRRRRSETIFCAIEPELIYGLMKRRRYAPPPPPKVYNHVEVANIFLGAGEVRFKEQKPTTESWQQVLGELDCWQMLEESAAGLSMQRGVGAGNARVRRGQLAAIRHGREGTAMVGEIRWAEETGDGRIEIGLEMLPGLARAGAVRYAEATAIMQASGRSPSAAALIIDNFKRARSAARGDRGAERGAPQAPANPFDAPAALPSIDEQMLTNTGANPTLRNYSEHASILLPVGWAREGNVIEFIDGPTSLKLRLRAIVARHGEFERLLFEIVV